MNARDYKGMNAAGQPRDVIPDWLDHTANAAWHLNIAAACNDAGPNAVGNEKEPPSDILANPVTQP